ncbi:MAG: hypothetical protein JJT99_11950 [Rhodobacteraceae bacterium]|nr:hypothetical protein [Paracoccaceae bacterium]
MPIRTAPFFRTTFAASALIAGAVLAQPDDIPPLDEFTDFVFEVVDFGFCMAPDISDDEIRAMITESGGQTFLQGTATAPQEVPLHGAGYFTRGDDDTAIAASMQAFLVPDDGKITQLCLVLLPMDGPDATEGSFALKGFQEFVDTEAPDPSYMLVGQHAGRNAVGEDVRLADLAQGAGHVTFAKEDGDEMTIEIAFEGMLGNGEMVEIAFSAALLEDEHVTFMYLRTP